MSNTTALRKQRPTSHAMTTTAQHTPLMEDTGPTVVSRGFLGLMVAQFLGALNDNMFRWLITFIGVKVFPDQKELIIAGAGICFVLPYVILAAPAGYLADRFSKQKVIVGCKVAEIFLMILGVGGIWLQKPWFMFIVVGLMGAQSALFSPSKYGVIPELVRSRSVPAANGLIGLSTVLGIVLGAMAGGGLFEFTKPYGLDGLWLSALALIGAATVGTLASLLVPQLKVACPERRFPYNIVGHTISDLSFLAKRRTLLTVALGNAIFWGMGALIQATIPPYGTDMLTISESMVTMMLGIVAIGIGVGSVLSGIWSAGRIEMGIVPFGASLMAACAMGMYFLAPSAAVAGSPDMTLFYWGLVVLFGLGVGGGLYDIPLESCLQRQSDDDTRGRIIAGSNFLSFSAMLVAYGIFYLLSTLFHLSPAGIFLLSGLTMIAVALGVLVKVPAATVRATVWLLTRFMYRVRTDGLEHVPVKGGALFVCNHVSWVDAVLLILAFPREVRMIAYEEHVELWWTRWITNEMGTIKMNGSRKSMVRAIREARDGLANGNLVCIFPEGQITRTGRMNEFQPGFLSILGDLDVPVIPIRLHGLWGSLFSFERGRFFWKWPKRLFRYRVNITIGQPMYKPLDIPTVQRAVEALAPAEVPEMETETV